MLLHSCSACTRRRLDSAAMFPLGDLSYRFIYLLTLMDLSKFGGFMSYKADPPPPLFGFNLILIATIENYISSLLSPLGSKTAEPDCYKTYGKYHLPIFIFVSQRICF
jgi:hypothetical protein